MRKPIRKTVQKLTLALTVVTVLASCSKSDGGGGNSGASKTTLISKSPWILGKFESKVNTSPWTDGYSVLSACIKDNKSIFAANGTYTLDEGTTKCDSGDPQTTTLNWSFGSNEAVLTIAGTAYTLEQLTETTLVYSSSSNNSGSTFSTRYTFHH
jgi:hypothetical protein